MLMSHKIKIRRGLHDGQQAFLAAIGNADIEIPLDLLGDYRGRFTIVFDAQDLPARLCRSAHKLGPNGSVRRFIEAMVDEK